MSDGRVIVQQPYDEAARRRRARRAALVLGVVALGFYFGFMVMRYYA